MLASARVFSECKTGFTLPTALLCPREPRSKGHFQTRASSLARAALRRQGDQQTTAPTSCRQTTA